jgi:hypothetical protein
MKGCILSRVRFAYDVRAAQKQELPLHLPTILEHPHFMLARDAMIASISFGCALCATLPVSL